jgi:hypothetical protein
MWQLAVFPLLPLPIPGTPVVIPVPIVSDRELNDRDTEARGVRVERHVTALVVISDIRRVEPSAIVSKHHIAPAPIVEAAHHLDRLIGIELRNHWIAVVTAFCVAAAADKASRYAPKQRRKQLGVLIAYLQSCSCNAREVQVFHTRPGPSLNRDDPILQGFSPVGRLQIGIARHDRHTR